MAAEALSRAQSGQSMANWVPIFEGFAAKGIPMEEIKPRENVLTYHAWRAKGRQVRKGEHGVKCLTYVRPKRKGEQAPPDADANTKDKRGLIPWSTTVFHESQTDPIPA
jgi:antirestriction protein ArdC